MDHASRWYVAHPLLFVGILVPTPGLLELSGLAAARKPAGYAARVFVLIGAGAFASVFVGEMIAFFIGLAAFASPLISGGGTRRSIATRSRADPRRDVDAITMGARSLICVGRALGSAPNPARAGQEMEKCDKQRAADNRPHDRKRIAAHAQNERLSEPELPSDPGSKERTDEPDGG